jgi:hypothetical protein
MLELYVASVLSKRQKLRAKRKPTGDDLNNPNSKVGGSAIEEEGLYQDEEEEEE